MGKLIGLAGRKESGKSELASICNKYGYETLSFATPLKTLIANLLGHESNTFNLVTILSHSSME